MKILNTEDFAKLPEGTLFSEYDKDGNLEELRIKGESWTPTSVLSASVNDIECSWNFITLKAGDSSPHYTAYTRDVYSIDAMFAVWEKEDLLKLATIVEKALEVTEL